MEKNFIVSSDEKLTALVELQRFSREPQNESSGASIAARSVNNEAKIRPIGIKFLQIRQIIRCINASEQTINVATSPFYPLPLGLGTDADYSSE